MTPNQKAKGKNQKWWSRDSPPSASFAREGQAAATCEFLIFAF